MAETESLVTTRREPLQAVRKATNHLSIRDFVPSLAVAVSQG